MPNSTPTLSLDGLYSMSPSSSPSPSANLGASGQSQGFNEDAIYTHLYSLQNAIQSTDLAVKNQALEELQRFISELHHVIKGLKKDRAEAQARLVNIAASSRGKAMLDDKNGGSGALLIPADAAALANVLKAQALKLGNIWTVFHSLHAPAYLFGSAPPVGWKWDDFAIRYRDSKNRELGNVSELFSIMPAPLHSYVLRADDTFKKNFFKTCSNIRATIVSRVVTAAPTILVDFEITIQRSIEVEGDRRGAALQYKDETGTPRPLAFGPALFNRNTDGRDEIPAMTKLIGLADGTRWANCLFQDGVSGPGKVPFGHTSLLAVASIMVYGPKACGQRRLVFRSDSQLAPEKDKLRTNPSLMANAAGLVRYLMSPDKEFVNSGAGAISGIPYAQDIEEYKLFLAKNWDDPRIQAIVERWDRRLFPLATSRREPEEDLSEELQNLNFDDSADAMDGRFNAFPQEQEPEPPAPQQHALQLSPQPSQDHMSASDGTLSYIGGGRVPSPPPALELISGHLRASQQSRRRRGFQVENADYQDDFGSDSESGDELRREEPAQQYTLTDPSPAGLTIQQQHDTQSLSAQHPPTPSHNPSAMATQPPADRGAFDNPYSTAAPGTMPPINAAYAHPPHHLGYGGIWPYPHTGGLSNNGQNYRYPHSGQHPFIQEGIPNYPGYMPRQNVVAESNPGSFAFQGPVPYPPGFGALSGGPFSGPSLHIDDTAAMRQQGPFSRPPVQVPTSSATPSIQASTSSTPLVQTISSSTTPPVQTIGSSATPPVQTIGSSTTPPIQMTASSTMPLVQTTALGKEIHPTPGSSPPPTTDTRPPAPRRTTRSKKASTVEVSDGTPALAGKTTAKTGARGGRRKAAQT